MHSYKGIVQKGTKRAAELGFPTVNIPLESADISGIYAARVKAEGKELFAAAFADPERKVLEAYLFDFAGDLYGKEITVELFEKIRESELFSDDVALKKSVDNDIARVREYFKNRSMY